MHEEAASAPERVALQLDANEDQYRGVGRWLSQRRQSSTVTIARGSSDHAAAYYAYLSAVRGGHLVTSLPMSLITLHQAAIPADGMLAVGISQSGRSPDLCAPMEQFRKGGAATVALLNEVNSPLGRVVEWAIPLHAGPERSVAATKSFICSLVAGARLVAHRNDDRDLGVALRHLPEALRRACLQSWAGAGIEALLDAQRIMVIGRGTGLAIAQEAALKFKETCGIQAEAFSSAEVKHGPMALIGPGYPMLVFAPRGPAQPDLLALAEEMRERGATVLLAAPADVRQRQLTLEKTIAPDLDPIAAIQSFYLMVEALAVARGMSPDEPPYLKKVTSTL